ncbi:TspO/MBR family protein [Roseibium album]|uniref:TspO/MBR family protein n=1 Tax=Roseibium album TaxID=311410 RepID=UPI002492F406|nr:TspO/MBR family protein [Roseibium album]
MTIDDPTQPRQPRSTALLALFLVVVIGMGIFVGTQSAPGSWYQELEKPVFNPPNWIFAPVWTVLYVFIAVAGWRTFLRAPRSMAMKFWYGQMALNWIWSPVFFVLHLTWAAFAVIAAMLILIVLFVGKNWRADRVSAALFLPYALWVGFAGLLNFSLALLN